MKTRLANYLKASFPAVAILTSEEQRAQDDVLAAVSLSADKDGVEKAVVTWSATEGMVQIRPKVQPFQNSQDLTPALLNPKHKIPNCVYILRDINSWPFDRDPVMTRALRDMLIWGPPVGSCVVMIGTEFKPQPSIEKMVTIIDYSLPNDKDLRAIAKGVAESGSVEFNGEGDEVVRALSGLNTTEAENACALSLIETGKIDASIIYREKVQGVRKSGLLEIIEPDPRGMDAIGGLDLFKEFVTERAEMFKRWADARAFGLSMIKGILLVGLPGTGKSLSAKVIGATFGIPMLRWDVAGTFGSLVGETERKTRETLALADAMAPCGLWMDEVDKAFAGTQSGGSNDSGVGMRMFGQVITWMQERKSPVFLFATANDVRNLPSAFYRKGRFDEIFSVDLPNATEREAIFRVHLMKRKRDPELFDVQGFAAAARDFVGAEIEAVVEGAMFRAFAQRRELTEQDVLGVIEKTVPISKTASAEIDAIRAWGQRNATPASSPEVIVVPKATRKLR